FLVFLWDLLILAGLLVKSLLDHELIDFLTRQLLEVEALKLLVLFVEQKQLRRRSSNVLELSVVEEREVLLDELLRSRIPVELSSTA
ncbi:hypothetical protein K1D78_25535, partial [Escherichia coli]|nr:hypothetical protein [Escherichia coli]